MGTPTLIVVWIEPTATDNSGLEPERMQTHLPGESFPVGTTNVMYLFQDEAGNQAICAFDVTGNNFCLRNLQLIVLVLMEFRKLVRLVVLELWFR